MLGNLRKTLQYCRRKTFFIYLAVKKWHDIFMMKLLQWKDVNSVYRTLRVLLHANLLNDRSMSSFTCTYTTGKEKKTLRFNYRSLSDEQNLTLNLSYIRFWSKFNKVILMYIAHDDRVNNSLCSLYISFPLGVMLSYAIYHSDSAICKLSQRSQNSLLIK